jgi:hypothetical protein
MINRIFEADAENLRLERGATPIIHIYLNPETAKWEGKKSTYGRELTIKGRVIATFGNHATIEYRVGQDPIDDGFTTPQERYHALQEMLR